MKKFFMAVGVASTLLLTACSDDISEDLHEELKVYTSFSAMSAITKPLLTNDDILIQLTDGGIEPHDYEPTARDIANISEADLFIFNGLGFEHYTDKIEASVDESVNFVRASENISYVSENEVGVDPHCWLNLDNALILANNIVECLIEKDAVNQEIYKDNLNAFTSYISELKISYDDVLSEYDDTVVVLHPAYAYIFEPYGIEQMAIQKNHEVEPTISEIKEVVDYINENNIRYVFASTDSSSKPLNTVIEETGVEVLILDSMENINEEDIKTSTYIDIMTKNLESLKIYKN